VLLVYLIGWGIIGGFITGLGLLGLGDPYSSLYKGVNNIQIIVSLILVVTGLLVLTIGSLASLFKVYAGMVKGKNVQ